VDAAVPSDFFVNGFVSIPGETRERLVAYGVNQLYQPHVGLYDARNNTWETQVISTIPETVTEAHGILLKDGQSFGLLMGVFDYPNGLEHTDWITHDAQGWHVEDRPARWAMRSPAGIALVDGQVYGLLGAVSLELWRLSSAGWVQDPPIPGAIGGTLSGNATHLQLCLLKTSMDIVFSTRTPTETIYREEVLRPSSGPGVGSLVCAMASDGRSRPTLAWWSPVFRIGGNFDQNLYAAGYANGKWNVSRLGSSGAEPRAMVFTAEGSIIYSFPTQGGVPQLWFGTNGAWSHCKGGMKPDTWMVPDESALIQWNGRAAFVNDFGRPSYQGNVTIQPLSAKVMRCEN
jgi:hypothetical protein